MTHKRSWLALSALLTAIIGGTVWAAGQEKTCPAEPDTACCTAEKLGDPLVEEKACCEQKCAVEAKGCCEAKCCTVKTGKTCCQGKCCTTEMSKGCCADGECCGCCKKAKKAASAVKEFVREFVLVAPPPPPPCMALPPMPDVYQQRAWCEPPVQVCPSVPQPAPSMQYTPVTQYIATSQVVPPPPPAPQCVPPSFVRPQNNPWRLRAVVEKEHACLEMQLTAGGEDGCAYCDSMTLKIGNESLKVSVGDKQVHVKGSFVTGSADTITRNTADGSVLLEGHVKVKYEKDGQKADVSAERVVVGVADGRLEVKPVEHQQQILTFWINGLPR